MSDRGSILISTANDIGEALVEKLEGSGYSPAEWRDEMNKLGIAEVDSAPALSVLEDSSETGTARGSILLSTANAIGAVLNKKYNTDRGFKPKEWASATSKLAPLPEKSAESSPICAIEDGADDVPSRSLVVTIPPTLTGTAQIIEKRSGRNLLSMVNYDGGVYNPDVDRVLNLTVSETQFTKNGSVYSVTTSSTWKTYTVLFPIVSGVTYYEKWTLSIESGQQGSTRAYLDENFKVLAKYNNNISDPIVTNGVMTPPAGTKYLAITWTNRSTAIQTLNITEPMIEIGSTSSTWEEYDATSYTADLGRTVYGGTADIVNGVGLNGYNKITLSSLLTDLSVVQIGTTGVYRIMFNLADAKGAVNSAVFNGLCDYYTLLSSNQTYSQNEGISINTSGQCYIYDSRFNTSSSLNDFKTWIDANPVNLCYELATPEEFTFDGQEIPTKEGYNAFWSDQGNTALDYYGEPEPYTRGTASGGIANIQSARTDLPFTKVKANIAPNLTGVESVEVNKCGVNLFDKTTITPYTWIIVNSTDTESTVSYLTSDYIPVKANTKYYVSTKSSNRSAYYDRNKNGIAYFSFSGGASFTALYDGYIRITINNNIDLDTFIVNEGDTEATYEQYNKTTYTADLGEPVYGGSVDLVSGEVVKDCTKGSMSSTYLSGLNSDYIGYESSTAYFNNHPSIWVRNWNYQTAAPRVSGGIKCACNEFPVSMHNTTIFSAQYRIYFDVYGKNITSVQDFIDYVEDLEQNGKSLDIAYEVADPTESSITPQVISPSEGVNNLWNNAGGDTDVEYFTQE